METDIFVKNLLLIAVFLLLTPVALGTSLFALISISTSSNVETQEVLAASNRNLVYASLPGELANISSTVGTSDARVEIIKQYLRKYKSPLLPQAATLVEMADKYGLDFRLTTAIAQQESNLCKKIPPGTYNCWGWGIHSEGTLGFKTYEHGIETVSRGLKKGYLDKGYLTPEDIMSKYTPQSNGSWALGVNEFMSEMQ